MVVEVSENGSDLIQVWTQGSWISTSHKVNPTINKVNKKLWVLWIVTNSIQQLKWIHRSYDSWVLWIVTNLIQQLKWMHRYDSWVLWIVTNLIQQLKWIHRSYDFMSSLNCDQLKGQLVHNHTYILCHCDILQRGFCSTTRWVYLCRILT